MKRFIPVLTVVGLVMMVGKPLAQANDSAGAEGDFRYGTEVQMMGSTRPSDDVQTVPYVDLNRYIGKWYELGSFPASFQKDCVGSTAEYSLRNDGKIEVLNQCWVKSFTGKHKRAKGKAWVVDTTTNAKLKVQFFWPFTGDYWVVALGENYEYAVVSEPNRDYLWILSRTKTLPEEVLSGIVKDLQARGWDMSRLKWTPQPTDI